MRTLIPAQEFGDNLEALVWYAASLDRDSGVELLFAALERAAGSGGRVELPVEWLRTLQRVAQTDVFGVSATRLFRWVAAGGLDETRRELVPSLVVWTTLPKDHAKMLAMWIFDHAEPGDATWVADVFEKVALPNQPGPTSVRLPLARWLLKRGAAQLRSASGWRQALLVLETLVEAEASNGELESAIAVLLSNSAVWLRVSDWARRLTLALGASLARGARPDTLRRWLRGLEPAAMTSVSHVLAQGAGDAEILLVAKEVVGALLEGRVHRDAEHSVWQLAIGLHPPQQCHHDVAFKTARSGLTAIRDARASHRERWRGVSSTPGRPRRPFGPRSSRYLPRPSPTATPGRAFHPRRSVDR